MKIPFLDLSAHHAPFRGEFVEAFSKVMDASAFAGGEFVSEFERQFAEFCGVDHAVGLSSGTDALWLPLLALGIGPGDEVITVPMTFIATVEAILRTGAKPVFVDIDPTTYTMCPRALEQAITDRTKAIVPVHLFGRLADMKSILTIAGHHSIPVIEDAAQAHGASDETRRMAGAFGHAGAFSFYPGKNLGAFGDAGAMVTNDPEIASFARMVRDHGQSQKYVHRVMGWNCRMDGIQAAVLSLKLPRLHECNAKRKEHARFYSENLCGMPDIILPTRNDDIGHANHIYAIKTNHREELMSHLQKHGVGYGIHYPIPAHLQPCCSDLGWSKGNLPVSEACAGEFLSLPMYPELTIGQLGMVAKAIQQFAAAKAA